MSVVLGLNYEEQLDKVRGICEKNKLEFELRKDRFPIVMTIRPQWEDAAQARLEFPCLPDDKPKTDPDAWIKLIFGNELVISTSLDFVIDDDLFSKIKNSCKKLHYAFLQLFFETVKTAEKAAE